jgi:hypothetical protein
MKFDLKNLTVEKCKDSGLALVLMSLICYQVWKMEILILLAIIFLVIAMTYPLIFKPFAIFWFTLSTALGTVVSKIILSGLFFVIVMPIGLFRRALGKDAMQIKSWKKGNDSVFRERKQRFAAKTWNIPIKKEGYLALVILAAINTAISIYYYLSVVRISYCTDPEDPSILYSLHPTHLYVAIPSAHSS